MTNTNKSVNLEYLEKGSLVYSIYLNNIVKYKIEDVTITVKDFGPVVDYTVLNTENNNRTHLKKEQIFSSIEDLKEYVLKQFDNLTPKTGEGEGKSEFKNKMANAESI